MAKMAGKTTSFGRKSNVSQKLNPRFYAAKTGGKKIKAYQFNQKRNRRLSIADSTSSDSSDGLAGKDHFSHDQFGSGSDSDSDSSLTAMSEEHEKVASRKGSVIFDSASAAALKTKPQRSQMSGKSSKSFGSARPTKSLKSARKEVYGKSISYTAALSSDEELADDDGDEDDDIEEFTDREDPFAQIKVVGADDEDNDKIGLEAIYSMVGRTNNYPSSNSEESNDEDSHDDDELDSSSSDDSEVDFVRLQVERRKNNVNPGQKPGKEKNPKDLQASSTVKTKRRKSSIYRRRSEVAIPEDINFRFEFDDPIAELAIEDFSEGDNNFTDLKKEEEEDLGEEVLDDKSHKSFDFHFDQPLIEVPKINEEELNSDDEYAFDDNDLLATLQADNDFDEFIKEPQSGFSKVRQGSLSSMNDDENEDSFLKEEEKYLVNEFEANGFDEDDIDSERMETARAVNSFNEIDSTGAQSSQAVQYASSSDERSQYSEDDEADEAVEYDFDEEDGDEYVDFIDFDQPLFDDANSKLEGVKEISSQNLQKKQSKKKKAHFPKRKKGPLDSEDEDDSYLWNYFFSSDAEAYSGSEIDQYDADEQLVLEEVFRQNLEDRKRQLERESSMEPVEPGQDLGEESGESTDVDLSLPSHVDDGGVGSKLAKEVLSSKTADYRPPVLGTWAALDSKPFGIIDGLSTRTLNNQSGAKTPRAKNWRGFAFKSNSDDLAIELEELLNVSELDNDDENDVRIWRDFNNNKKHVPLGAFRNKAHISHPMVVAEPMTNYNDSKNTNYNRKRRHSHSHVKAKLALRSLEHAPPPSSPSLSKDLNLPSKLKLRRASIADAVSEGYRPTKSGLFSENVLADVEEVLGEDRDFMALVTGL
ncbi:hypothetical protein METBIDRAFT_42973 [Metschnikowia bicuspidata var. bicuspidata NRRL YB-4993]|uniref:Protein IFH1 n=1 Tax=Metschnikowia bicuspidata var. bicuspidata NRRL YB-4993 TaxID=869754 RepID=A0A1A0H8S2_9ASCO|nr:hypothetical protein METBIDRAFT_42973 [Metschnikowia bicuspidata var. bicuspidata NRRL YB-4993]OBA20282.1 hypothetical protein METBIDRAFT_42973 [Metschnikowia bicuspidata var. bicuspidata NRRL YB-4993]